MLSQTLLERQVLSKKRVFDHGEVFTASREVNAMLDLVQQETERIDSRFLEPACGTGNFLVEVLDRKLKVVEDRYKKNQLDYEKNSVTAISSIYGIDIQNDNVVDCRKRLFDVFEKRYAKLYKNKIRNECRDAVRYILRLNIVLGDALTLQTVGENPDPIVFSQWSFALGCMLKRRDFSFHELFNSEDNKVPSDLGADGFIPKQVRDYPLTHFLRIADVK